MKVAHGKPVVFTNVVSNNIEISPSIKQAAEKLNTSDTTIRRHLLNSSKLYGLYLIRKKDFLT